MNKSLELRNLQAAAYNTVAGNAAKLEIYSGTKPVNTTGGEGTLLATFTMSSPLSPAPTTGVLNATLPADTTWTGNGTVGWARLNKADGSTAVIDLTCGTSGADVNLSSLTAVSGGTVSMTSFAITIGGA